MGEVMGEGKDDGKDEGENGEGEVSLDPSINVMREGVAGTT